MIMSSIKTENDYRVNILSFPREIRLMNYFDVFIGSKIYYYMLNSFINVLVVVPISLFFVFVTGYLLSRYKFFGRNLIYGLFMLGVFLPMHVILVPIYLEFSWLNMLDKRYTLWIPLIAFSLSMSIFIVESFIRTIPRSIEEAAFIDGASFHYSMSRIMAPMCTPALSTSLILIFIGVWNEFALSYTLLQKNTYRTISYAIRLFESTNTTTLTLQLTALVLASIPVIILYIAFSDQIISGMVAGAVKG
jgi:raffinose/stachyose/melibiose transport system permease protein